MQVCCLWWGQRLWQNHLQWHWWLSRVPLLLPEMTQSGQAGGWRVPLMPPPPCPSQGHARCPPRLPCQAVNSGQRRVEGQALAASSRSLPVEGPQDAEGFSVKDQTSPGGFMVWADARGDRKCSKWGSPLLLQLNGCFLWQSGLGNGFCFSFFLFFDDSHIIKLTPLNYAT